MEPKWLEWAKQIQSIAQAGKAYANNDFDMERYEALQQLSVEIMVHHTYTDQSIIKELFANETGYATPKADIRSVVFRDGKLLMVQEKSDGAWALPGGWGDIGLTPSEVAVKEVKEEAGFDVQPVKLIGVLDKKCHPHPPSPYHVYKILIQCEIIGGEASESIETSAVGFFSEDDLPPLSIGRNTESQINLAFRHLHKTDEPGYLD
ncbi:NUDIX hydrolase [Virgibacillus siamensis]|uniref:NUDIX hydrolase n=1 Tax=Virgibacillus siamensis TaxID=480071 RepID=UPI000986BEA5|nr:NUDIX hydrolase [Virgibacillus siamensis]